MAIKPNKFVKSIVPEEWKKVLQAVASEFGDIVDVEELEVIPLKGAMTNEVYQINWSTKDDDVSRKVLLRVYGDGVDIFFNRDDEIKTFECLSKHGQGPLLLGRFANGRVEEFIHARTLSANDLRDPEISALIAAKMREFHKLDIPGPKNVVLWNRMRNWISEAKSLCSLKDAKEFRLDTLEDEINMLEKELSHDYQEIGFCHNDLQYGNIMMDEDSRAITLIDYEYASYNPLAYDLANHFCEMAANYHSDKPHILDYSLYPDLEERQRFARVYLSCSGNEPSDREVEQLVNEAEKFTLANHLFWGLWGIISGYVNKIDFDYMEYARQRFQQYWLRKPALLGSSGDSPL
ncbi:probable choline kinase 1 [Ziziphus jujuba]|uniref:Probable choline kinase 1 n=1 Tax=Ziziphus jujuba TaxID=326968 RepID=A0A6P4AKL8_ZIZJJ|nr:probable choline kinase 1 [Ziziphus jujuba]XP_024930796.3 probable choline kinase 1 [Ziziphus jujuba]